MAEQKTVPGQGVYNRSDLITKIPWWCLFFFCTLMNSHMSVCQVAQRLVAEYDGIYWESGNCASASVLLQLNMSEPNSIIYFGLFEGRDPNPSKDPGYIIMSSFLVFYKWFHLQMQSTSWEWTCERGLFVSWNPSLGCCGCLFRCVLKRKSPLIVEIHFLQL